MHLTPERRQEEGIVAGRCLGTQTDLNNRPLCLLESCDHLCPPTTKVLLIFISKLKVLPASACLEARPPLIVPACSICCFGSPTAINTPPLILPSPLSPRRRPGRTAPNILSGCWALTAWLAAEVWGKRSGQSGGIAPSSHRRSV